MPPMNKDLSAILPKYIQSWRSMSRFYAGVSVLLRGLMIIASALVAAKAGLNTVLTETTFSELSVTVAAGTALEAWLKPREKWRGFMTDCENTEDIAMRLQNTDSADVKAIDDLRKEFQTILATHREKNVF
jgi:hypothetical protein